MLPSSPLTEPDVQISSFRFLTGELRSQRCSDGRSEVPVRGTALKDRYTDPKGIGSLAATATSARSSEPDRRTRLIAAFPEISIDLHLSDAMTDVIGEGFDAAIRIAVQPGASLVVQRLCEVRATWSARPLT
jgi:DNA-binding transcriptional LysR family regulator